MNRKFKPDCSRTAAPAGSNFVKRGAADSSGATGSQNVVDRILKGADLVDIAV